MNAQELSLAAGVVLSLAFSYTPGLAPRFAAFDRTQKSLVMLVVLALVAVGTFAVSCGGLMALVVCDKPGAVSLFTNFVSALIANQATFLISPQPALPATTASTGAGVIAPWSGVQRASRPDPAPVEPKAPNVESHL